MWDLVPWEPPALEVWSLSHWTTREVLKLQIFIDNFSSKEINKKRVSVFLSFFFDMASNSDIDYEPFG